MSAVQVLYVGNDTTVEMAGLRNRDSGDVLSSATVSVTLLDSAGLAVSGASWPQMMAPVVDSPGVFRATLPASLALVANAEYVAALSASDISGVSAAWKLHFEARVRRA